MSPYQLPNESAEYQMLRAELLEAEIALKQQRERVAELRRKLPVDTKVPAYTLREEAPDGGVRDVTLPELFDDPAKPLVLMQFMYGKAQQNPCPMCTLWADGYDGIVSHLLEHANFGVLAAADPSSFRDHARSRGWRNLRLISAGDSTLKRDLGFEDEEGAQVPGVSVFSLDSNGDPVHFYSGGAMLGDGMGRGMDLLSPLWNFLDLTPNGRGEFMPKLAY
jgi:predicted dithiol-disulfide oxidoreductase (DUF899 family)